MTLLPGRLVVAGKLVVDEILTCALPLSPGSVQRAVASTLTGGGQVWHTARAARRAGAPVAVVGWCGHDPATESLRAELSAAGITDSLVPAGEASRALVLVGPDGERTIVATGGAARLPADALHHGMLLDGAAWLHLDGFCLDDRSGDALVALAAAAEQRDIPVSLEPASLGSLPARRHWLGDLPPLAALLGRPEENTAALQLLAAAPHCLVAHDGSQPVRTTTTGTGEVLHTPVQACPVATTGAGDRFAGGWLAARLRGATPAEAADAGITAAQQRRLATGPQSNASRLPLP